VCESRPWIEVENDGPAAERPVAVRPQDLSPIDERVEPGDARPTSRTHSSPQRGQQVWDVPTASNSTVGRALTIMALTARACEFIAGEHATEVCPGRRRRSPDHEPLPGGLPECATWLIRCWARDAFSASRPGQWSPFRSSSGQRTAVNDGNHPALPGRRVGSTKPLRKVRGKPRRACHAEVRGFESLIASSCAGKRGLSVAMMRTCARCVPKLSQVICSRGVRFTPVPVPIVDEPLENPLLESRPATG
jgi:hypothetical protein